MTLAALEVMALIVVVLGAVKLFVLMTNPGSWMKVIKAVYSNPNVAVMLALLFSAITLWYLLKSVTVVQIFATMLFVMFFMWMGFAAHPKETMEFANKLYHKHDIFRRHWLSILIWLVLMVWVVYSIFS